uniref:Pyrokinin-4 n=2 Tax=Validiblatta TaxID=3455766 RepID=PPK4_VALBR|nr:RecName: Full=Pyrokinin-4; Short=Pef-PK-4; AltName: Full=YXPRL-amide [Periplaneta fuliginosa]P84358.1 RecName: Full=Pyrokinin-4; Short=Peb-PK-4; AltName: Full=YXPRL-amide [Periplaneta brunnea]
DHLSHDVYSPRL